jgi:hypothetical protein
MSELATLGASGILFSAFCVWLTVQIINRRERWAIDTAMAIALMLVVFAVAGLVLYPLSHGPWIAIYIATHANQPEIIDASSAFYAPIDFAIENSPPAIQDAYDGYLEWWAGLGVSLIVP